MERNNSGYIKLHFLGGAMEIGGSCMYLSDYK